MSHDVAARQSRQQELRLLLASNRGDELVALYNRTQGQPPDYRPYAGIGFSEMIETILRTEFAEAS